MAKCPACRSDRVYKGYRPAPLLLRLLRFHNCLCENCNLQFRGFSFLPPRSRRQKGKKNHSQQNSRIIEPDTPVKITEPAPMSQSHTHLQSNPLIAQAASAGASGGSQPLPPKAMPTQSESTKPTIKGQWEMPAQTLAELETSRRSHRSHQVCPHCGATDTERRRRRLWEKAAFVFTTIRAYKCRICGSDFYARRKQKTEA